MEPAGVEFAEEETEDAVEDLEPPTVSSPNLLRPLNYENLQLVDKDVELVKLGENGHKFKINTKNLQPQVDISHSIKWHEIIQDSDEEVVPAAEEIIPKQTRKSKRRK